jgi:hypothetical protein
MFILNDVDLSNYGRGRDRTKRKSRSLRNAAIGVGALAVAGGLGYMALKGKGKSVTQPIVPKNQPLSYSQLTREELKKLTSKQRLDLRRKAILNELGTNDNAIDEMNMMRQSYPLRTDAAHKKQFINNERLDFYTKNVKGTREEHLKDFEKDYLNTTNRQKEQTKQLMKLKANKVKRAVQSLKSKGAYYSSYLTLNNF